jgi:signal transduction histidine kinase
MPDPVRPVTDSVEALRFDSDRVIAILKAVPDLMFVILRDGTFVDYSARDPRLLYVPPSVFMGRRVADVMPPALAQTIMNALERAAASSDPVIVEYELSTDELRHYECRIVHADAGRFLSIIRDVTEWKRAQALNRDLAGRLIASQEVERQRIARELHDDVSQRLTLLNFDLEQLADDTGAQDLRARLRELSGKVREIAADVHHISYELHPSRLRAIGLVGAIRLLCDEASQQRAIHVAFTHGTIPAAIDPELSLCLYRIVQEALHNAVRHSHAPEARVTLTCDDGQIALQVADTGVGFDVTRVLQAGLGLVSMRERVVSLKGQLAIDAVPGAGTRIEARVPLVTLAPDPSLMELT